jgi:hypothetical protein
VFSNKTMTDARVMAQASLSKKEKILIRVINASYSVLRITLGMNAQLVGVDGRMLGKHPYNWPETIPANTPQILTTAGRFDFLITPTKKGTFPAKIEFLDWIKGTVQDGGKGVASTQIRIV